MKQDAGPQKQSQDFNAWHGFPRGMGLSMPSRGGLPEGGKHPVVAQKEAPPHRESGFTLIEIMVVVVILAVLATLVVPKIMDRPGQARVVKAKQDIRTIESALNLYKLDNYVLPTTDQGLEALITQPDMEPRAPHWKQGGYLPRLPKDPWGRAYLYLNPGMHGGDVDIYTLGADGVKGGEESHADIGNWNLE